MEKILAAINSGADAETFAALEIPKSYRAAVILKEEADMFAGMASADKDPRKSVHIR